MKKERKEEEEEEEERRVTCILGSVIHRTQKCWHSSAAFYNSERVQIKVSKGKRPLG